ncbi:hypothetical protein [Galbibacter pacificus]|uniref:Lipoprotein n=1 Tax=Galbibacter pacificus TaxID=2996052 RepID=A0ABT6FLY4_9FLAO|nr:hypothetical protein [Galbibacter pacificus]MDG3580777.1 hypothetical protein [Galbibacter pacificus]MDG3584255.1 hypothetical protein [Galbibacter pacificus]
MNIKKIAFIALSATMIMSCNNKKGNNSDSSDNDFTRAGKPETMKTEIVANYFPKKDIAPNVIQFFTIDNQQEFDQKFGAAKTMNNEVTQIDFNENRVGVILLPESNRKEIIEIDDAKRIGSSVIIEYNIEEGEEQSFTSMAVLIFKLPGDNRLKTVEFKSGDETNIVNVEAK